MSNIRVLLVHDYELARRGLRRMLEGYDDIEVVGEAGNAVETVRQVELDSPDVVLMDAELPHITGLETMRIFKERGLPVVVGHAEPGPAEAGRCRSAGGRGLYG